MGIKAIKKEDLNRELDEAIAKLRQNPTPRNEVNVRMLDALRKVYEWVIDESKRKSEMDDVMNAAEVMLSSVMVTAIRSYALTKGMEGSEPFLVATFVSGTLKRVSKALGLGAVTEGVLYVDSEGNVVEEPLVDEKKKETLH